MEKSTLTQQEKSVLKNLGIDKFSNRNQALVKLKVLTKTKINSIKKNLENYLNSNEVKMFKLKKSIIFLEEQSIKNSDVIEISNHISLIDRMLNNQNGEANSLDEDEEFVENDDQEDDINYNHKIKTYSFDESFNPIPINFKKLQKFNINFFNHNEIAVFSHLLILHSNIKRDHKAFYHSMEQFKKELYMKRDAINTILKKFEFDLRIITSHKKSGLQMSKDYTLNFDKIINLIPLIFLKDAENTFFMYESYFCSIKNFRVIKKDYTNSSFVKNKTCRKRPIKYGVPYNSK